MAMTNTKELRVAMLRAGLTQSEIAKELDLSKQSVSKKVNGVVEFSSQEIARLSKILHLNTFDDLNLIFFSGELILNQQKTA